MNKLGIISGSGLYEMEELKNIKEVNLDTPFGKPSDSFVIGELNGTEVVFLARHARGHRILPSELNHKANIFGMKKLGVTHLVSISAVGSLKEDFKPRDIVFIDQYFDRTKRGLDHTFFGHGLVGHISFADPVCPELRELLYKIAVEAIKEEPHDSPAKHSEIHNGGIYINMEGPAFSTKAESNIYRSWGIDIIGMTSVAEAKLAREAEMCYSVLARVTDYDCWHPSHGSVTVDMVIENLNATAELSKTIVKKAAEKILQLPRQCICSKALASAIITDPKMISEELKDTLFPITGKYLPPNPEYKRKLI